MRSVRYLGAKLLLVPLLPVFLVVALTLLPFTLIGLSISEHRRLCPRCGLRGTLRDVTPSRPPPPGGGEFVRYRNRVSTTRRWRCEVCEAEFGERNGQLVAPVPDAPTGPDGLPAASGVLHSA